MLDNTALTIFEKHGPTLTAAQARSFGIHWENLYRLRDDDQINQLSRGVYRLASAPIPEWIDLITVLARAPKAVICLNSAAALWGLTDETPTSIHIAVARGKSKPRIVYPPVIVHAFTQPTFTFGRVEHELSSKELIAVYSPERTIVDLLRTDKNQTNEPIGELIRRYLARKDAAPSKLLKAAQKLGTGSAMRQLLEVILP